MANVKKKKQQDGAMKTWRASVEDQRLLGELRRLFGINDSSIVRMAIRQLAMDKGIALEA